ncbi:hypothetical protein AAG906_020602 [Vitis piasezkii]
MGEPSPLRNPLGTRGSACVEVMTTLHGSTSSPSRCAKVASPEVPPRFRLDLHYSYHQGPGHDTDHCNALRHAIQDLIDQGLVNLGQPSVTTNPLLAHSTHAVHPSSGDIHHIDLIEDDIIHMLSWDDGLPEPIVLHDSYEDTFIPFTLWPEDDDSRGGDLIVTRSGRIA